jgi:hypothetical protein
MKRVQTPSIHRELLSGPKSAPELAQALSLSQPGFSRLFKSGAEIERVRSFGAGRATLYAATRQISGLDSEFPVFRIDESGRIHAIGELTAIESRGFILVPPTGKPEVFPGIPFFFSDVRPQGYLGRVFALRHEDLGFPSRVPDWSEDQIFAALALRGEHLPGNLLVGKESFARFQNGKLPAPISLNKRAAEYEARSVDALHGSIPGSSAAGEQPKFPAFIEENRNVIVKFSPILSTSKGRRWGDLLIAESLALETLHDELGIPVARTEVVIGDQRIFLESTRFDRVGAQGRKGCTSFLSLEAEWIGAPSVWATSAKTFFAENRISAADAKKIQTIDAFGAWIANSDRHYGNLSFFYEVGQTSAELAPVYDMLPMFFAPKETEELEFARTWVKPNPIPETLAVWETARAAAQSFWGKVIADPRISADFKREAERVRKVLS